MVNTYNFVSSNLVKYFDSHGLENLIESAVLVFCAISCVLLFWYYFVHSFHALMVLVREGLVSSFVVSFNGINKRFFTSLVLY